MIQARAYIGIERNRAGDLIPRAVADRQLKEIRKRFMLVFGAYTEYETRGGWRDMTAKLDHEERAVVFQVTTNGEKRAAFRVVAKSAGNLLDQAAVWIEFQHVDGELLES